MARGRLEARLTFSANQQVSWTDAGGGPLTATVNAGSYYPTELAAALQTAIENLTGSVGFGATVSISRGESGATGRCTINGAANWSLSWTSTDIRDALGFTANIVSSGTSQTGANAVKGMWLPNSPSKFSRYGDGAAGSFRSDARFLKSLTGRLYGLYGSGHYEHVDIKWDSVTGARAMVVHESVTGESFQSFYLDCVTGRLSYIPSFPYIRLIWNADTDGTYAVGRVAWPPNFDLEQMVRGWTGRYVVDLPRLVVET